MLRVEYSCEKKAVVTFARSTTKIFSLFNFFFHSIDLKKMGRDWIQPLVCINKIYRYLTFRIGIFFLFYDLRYIGVKMSVRKFHRKIFYVRRFTISIWSSNFFPLMRSWINCRFLPSCFIGVAIVIAGNDK